MEIEDAKVDDIQSKIAPLMDAFKASPFLVAPERSSEMEAIRDRLGMRIRLNSVDRDWMFEGLRIFDITQVAVSLRSLERLWAYCYAYTAIITELQKAAGQYAKIKNPGEYELAFGLLQWAAQGTLAEKEGGWPDFLPDPRYKDDLEHVEAANHFFLMTSGRILLHEIAHSVLDHNSSPEASAEILLREEYEADKWADAWMLDSWREFKTDESVFVGRCMGIAFSHALPLVFGVGKSSSSTSHPPPIRRIIAFVDSWLPGGKPTDKRNVDLPCGFLLAIIGILLQSKKLPYDCDQLPETYSELFARFDPFFK